MKTSLSNRIAEVAKQIATENGVNFTFFVNEEKGIIEGCRRRKTSETYEYDVENEKFIYNTTKMDNLAGIIEEAISIVKEEIEEAEKSVIEISVEGFENAIIRENKKSYFVDLRTGMGEAEYPKFDWTLEQAIADQVNYKIE